MVHVVPYSVQLEAKIHEALQQTGFRVDLLINAIPLQDPAKKTTHLWTSPAALYIIIGDRDG